MRQKCKDAAMIDISSCILTFPNIALAYANSDPFLRSSIFHDLIRLHLLDFQSS